MTMTTAASIASIVTAVMIVLAELKWFMPIWRSSRVRRIRSACSRSCASVRGRLRSIRFRGKPQAQAISYSMHQGIEALRVSCPHVQVTTRDPNEAPPLEREDGLVDMERTWFVNHLFQQVHYSFRGGDCGLSSPGSGVGGGYPGRREYVVYDSRCNCVDLIDVRFCTRCGFGPVTRDQAKAYADFWRERMRHERPSDVTAEIRAVEDLAKHLEGIGKSRYWVNGIITTSITNEILNAIRADPSLVKPEEPPADDK